LKKRQYDASIVVLWPIMDRLVDVFLLAHGRIRAAAPRVRQSVVKIPHHIIPNIGDQHSEMLLSVVLYERKGFVKVVHSLLVCRQNLLRLGVVVSGLHCGVYHPFSYQK